MTTADGPRECRSPRCTALIVFAYAPGADPHTATGIPLDWDTIGNPAGNLASWRDDDGVIRYRYLRKDEPAGKGERRATSHFATCPDAARFRRRKEVPDASPP